MTWNNIGFSASCDRSFAVRWGLLLGLLVGFCLGGDLSGQVSGKLPVGYEKVGKETPLVAGARLQVYQSFKWNDVQVLELNDDGTVHVQFVGKPSSWDNDFKRSSLIISQKELDRLAGSASEEEAKPESKGESDEEVKGKSSFGKAEDGGKPADPKPDSDLTEKSSTALTGSGNLVPIPRETKLVAGIPIRAKIRNKWSDATVIEILSADQFKVKWDSGVQGESDVYRSETLVSRKVLAMLEKPEAEQMFASRAERVMKNVPSHTYRSSEYRIRLPLPKNFEKVTSQTPLRSGAKVGLNNYDRRTGQDRWWEATVVDLNWDETVRIHIDGESNLYDGDIDRNCLIILQSELTRLQSVASEEAEIAENTNEKWEELVSVTDDLKLFPGTPVYAEMFDGPQDATVLDFEGTRLHVVADATGGRETEDVERSEVKIRGKMLEALRLPGTEEKLLRRADRIMEKVSDHPFPTADYLPPPELPRGYVRVNDQTPLEVGARLQLFSNGKWWPVWIDDLNWDGSVRIRVPSGREQLFGDIERRCLVVDKGDLTAMEKSSRAEKSPFAGLNPSPSAKSSPKEEVAETSERPAKPAPSSGNYKVILKAFGQRKKITVAQAVSDLTGSEFGDTLTLLGSLPIEVQTKLSKKDAERAAGKLRGAGGEVDVVED